MRRVVRILVVALVLSVLAVYFEMAWIAVRRIEGLSGSWAWQGAWPGTPPADWPAEPRWAWSGTCATADVEAASTIDIRSDPTPVYVEFKWVRVRLGWPWRTGTYEVLEQERSRMDARGMRLLMIDSPASSLWRSGIRFPVTFESLMPPPTSTNGWSWRFESSHRRLPLRPVWPGFLAAVAVHAAALLLVVGAACAVKSLRRWARAQHDRCSACGYELRGLSACPECGALARRS